MLPPYITGVIDACTWQDNQPVTVMSSAPYMDRFQRPPDGEVSFVWRNVKGQNGRWYKSRFFRPEILRDFEQNMFGVDMMCV